MCIDTGVAGEIDAEQARWLIRMSRGDKSKVLLTGKPIYVDNHYRPGPIDWAGEIAAGGSGNLYDPALAPARADELPGNTDLRERFRTVDDVVRHEPYRYVAAFGGDIHNYQRYPVRIGTDRTIEYIVSGGGGAYLSATHRIPAVGGGPKAASRNNIGGGVRTM